ncbi:hypothetical protein C8Q79DRAFT_916581, partial [Trametes meyenii]
PATPGPSSRAYNPPWPSHARPRFPSYHRTPPHLPPRASHSMRPIAHRPSPSPSARLPKANSPRPAIQPILPRTNAQSSIAPERVTDRRPTCTMNDPHSPRSARARPSAIAMQRTYPNYVPQTLSNLHLPHPTQPVASLCTAASHLSASHIHTHRQFPSIHTFALPSRGAARRSRLRGHAP